MTTIDAQGNVHAGDGKFDGRAQSTSAADFPSAEMGDRMERIDFEIHSHESRLTAIRAEQHQLAVAQALLEANLPPGSTVGLLCWDEHPNADGSYDIDFSDAHDADGNLVNHPVLDHALPMGWGNGDHTDIDPFLTDDGERIDVDKVRDWARQQYRKPNVQRGDRVWWEDPDDGISSGWYEVAEADGESVTLRDAHGDISNEAFLHELSTSPECAEGGHVNDDNPGSPICRTCDDDPNVEAIYPNGDARCTNNDCRFLGERVGDHKCAPHVKES